MRLIITIFFFLTSQLLLSFTPSEEQCRQDVLDEIRDLHSGRLFFAKSDMLNSKLVNEAVKRHPFFYKSRIYRIMICHGN